MKGLHPLLNSPDGEGQQFKALLRVNLGCLISNSNITGPAVHLTNVPACSLLFFWLDRAINKILNIPVYS